jgi:hypothetical protein
MTYGWVLLGILIAIGALYYVGVFNPNRLIPDRCFFGSQMVCQDYQLTSTDVKLEIRNNYGKDINISNVWAETDEQVIIDTVSGTGCTGIPPSPDWLTISPGSTGEIICSPFEGGFAFSTRDKPIIKFTIEFFRGDLAGSPRHNVTGELYTAVTS